MTKRLVDIDDQALALAQAELGTETIKATVNEALLRASGARGTQVQKALDTLAGYVLDDREEAWR